MFSPPANQVPKIQTYDQLLALCKSSPQGRGIEWFQKNGVINPILHNEERVSNFIDELKQGWDPKNGVHLIAFTLERELLAKQQQRKAQETEQADYDSSVPSPPTSP